MAEKNNNNYENPSIQDKRTPIAYRARSGTTPEPLQPVTEGAVRVKTLRVLGVIVNHRLTMSDHIFQVLSAWSSSMFALRPMV